MGRTGRKRDGHVHILLTRGKEEDNFKKATRDHEFIQGEIESGKRFNYHHDLSPRIVPRDIECVVDRKVIEIPIEGTQLEPSKRRSKAQGKQAKIIKKFLMPDGVKTGFVKASRIGRESDKEDEEDIPVERESPVPDIIDPETGLLTKSEEKKLQRTYQTDWGGVDDGVLVISPPRMDAFPERQRTFTKTHHVRHGRATESMVRALQKMRDMNEEAIKKYESNLDMALAAPLPEPAKKPLTKAFKPVVPRMRPGLSERPSNTPKQRQTSVSKRKRKSTSPSDVDMADAPPMIDLVSSQEEDDDVHMASDAGTAPSDMDSDVGVPKRRRKFVASTSGGGDEEEEGEDFPDVGQMLEKWAPKKAIMLPPKKTVNRLPKNLRGKPVPIPVPKATLNRAKRGKRVVSSDDE